MRRPLIRWALHLAAGLALWAVTVGVRFWIRVEPGEQVWFMWVLAQGFCAASIGWMLHAKQ